MQVKTLMWLQKTSPGGDEKLIIKFIHVALHPDIDNHIVIQEGITINYVRLIECLQKLITLYNCIRK